MKNIERTVEYYYTSEGKAPFAEWYASVEDKKIQQVVDVRIARVQQGHFGDCSFVGNGIYELRIHLGSGWRIYFGQVSGYVVLLLRGGSKKSQSLDIEKAKMYFTDYKRRLK